MFCAVSAGSLFLRVILLCRFCYLVRAECRSVGIRPAWPVLAAGWLYTPAKVHFHERERSTVKRLYRYLGFFLFASGLCCATLLPWFAQTVYCDDVRAYVCNQMLAIS